MGMSTALQASPRNAAVAAFAAGVLAVTAFGVLVTGDTVEQAALGSLGYATGTAIGVYIAVARPGTDW